MDYFGLAVALMLGVLGFFIGWGARETKMLSDSTKAMIEAAQKQNVK